MMKEKKKIDVNLWPRLETIKNKYNSMWYMAFLCTIYTYNVSEVSFFEEKVILLNARGLCIKFWLIDWT